MYWVNFAFFEDTGMLLNIGHGGDFHFLLKSLFSLKSQLFYHFYKNHLIDLSYLIFETHFVASDKGCGADGTDLPRDNLASSINALDNDTRRTDIFVGVDVFGRGCLGGGGFQCHLPLKEIRQMLQY